MNVLDAAYHTVHDYPGGAEALAVRLGNKRGTSLSHEVRPPAGSTAKLGLMTAVEIMELSGDLRILNAICGRLNCAPPVPLPAGDHEDGCAAALAAEVARDFAELMGEVARDVADSVITDNELQRLERRFGELVAAGQRMLAHFGQINATAKPTAFPEVLG